MISWFLYSAEQRVYGATPGRQLLDRQRRCAVGQHGSASTALSIWCQRGRCCVQSAAAVCSLALTSAGREGEEAHLPEHHRLGEGKADVLLLCSHHTAMGVWLQLTTMSLHCHGSTELAYALTVDHPYPSLLTKPLLNIRRDFQFSRPLAIPRLDRLMKMRPNPSLYYLAGCVLSPQVVSRKTEKNVQIAADHCHWTSSVSSRRVQCSIAKIGASS